MSTITCGDADVIRGRIHLPLRGAWWAELVLDTDKAPTGSVKIEAADGLSLAGTVQRAGVYQDVVHARIVGGAGGLGKPCEPRAFQNAQLSDPLGVVTDASGDTLSGDVSATLKATLLTAWSSAKITAAQGLDEIVGYASSAGGATINWRYLGDGKLWLGSESWPTAKLATADELLELEPSSGRQVIGVATPSLLPGVDLDGVGHVLGVDHWIEPTQIRTWAWTAPNHLAALIADTVRAIVGLPVDPSAAPHIDKLALYPAEVKAASSDGKTLDIQPADERFSGMQRVKLRTGIPGAVCIVQPAPGAIVLLGWEGGDPSKPYCIPAWDAGAHATKVLFVADMVLVGQESGAQKMVRGDDLMQRIQNIEDKVDHHTHAVTGTCPFGGGDLAGGTAAPTTNVTSHTPDFRAQKGKVY